MGRYIAKRIALLIPTVLTVIGNLSQKLTSKMKEIR
tara:strand:- start:259 stop:366 length:108 start_codon:yes stop_codon:yes gene_type:complete